MKIKVREVWETNSSSCHSVSISKHKIANFATPKPEEDGYIHATFDEFGWEQARYNNPSTKLSYALTMVAMTEMHDIDKDEFYKSEGFNAINELIKKKTGCKGVIVDDDFKNGYWGINGYIDHQSCEDYNSLQAFLDDWNVSLEDFIFNSDVILKTDNDNY